MFIGVYSWADQGIVHPRGEVQCQCRNKARDAELKQLPVTSHSRASSRTPSLLKSSRTPSLWTSSRTLSPGTQRISMSATPPRLSDTPPLLAGGFVEVPVPHVPFGGDSDYMRMLREAQGETSCRTSCMVSPYLSHNSPQGGSISFT